MNEADEPVGVEQNVVPSDDAPKRVRLSDQTEEEIERVREAVGLVHTIQKSNTRGMGPSQVTRQTVPLDAKSPFIKSNER